MDGHNTFGYSKDGFKKIGYNNTEVKSIPEAQLTKSTNIEEIILIDKNLEDVVRGLEAFENKEFILTALSMIKKNSKVFDGVIEYLANKNYCKDIFELQFELLREIKPEFSSYEIERLYYNDTDCLYSRYYKKDTFTYKNKTYIVCNHWYGIQRAKFIKWMVAKFA